MTDQFYAVIIQRAISYLEKHIYEDIGLDELARYCSVSKWHLHRMFQKVTGLNVAEYVRRRRLTFAAHLLATTNERILDIALMHHFSSQESFTRAFKKMFSMTPNEFRTFSAKYMMIWEEQNMNLPKGWMAAGSKPAYYEMGVEKPSDEKAYGFIHAKQEVPVEDFGTLMQMFNARQYIGRRYRLSGYIKTDQVPEAAALWMRVDGMNNEMLAFDNMLDDRAAKGTQDWKKLAIVLDIPEGSKAIAFGLMLIGTGKTWLHSLKFEEVDTSVPTTNMLAVDQLEEAAELPLQPINLDFREE